VLTILFCTIRLFAFQTLLVAASVIHVVQGLAVAGAALFGIRSTVLLYRMTGPGEPQKMAFSLPKRTAGDLCQSQYWHG
jgi:hypothetical protein